MVPFHPVVVGAAALAWVAAPPAPRAPADDPVPVVSANDNRVPAGRSRDGVLRLDLEVRMGRWYPDADGGASLTLPVLAEAGQAPEIPAPLIRVPAGTVVVISVRNHLPDSQVVVRGLHTRPAAAADSLIVPSGERLRYRRAVVVR